MASLKQLEMFDAFSKLDHVEIKNGFLGLSKKATYTPTQSQIDATAEEYTPDQGEKLLKLLSLPVSQLVEAVKREGKPVAAPIGHFRLESCIARDRQFVALQLFRFADFKYNKATDMKVFEGAEADAVLTLL